MPAQTDAQRQKAHRKRTKEKLARLERYEAALEEILALGGRPAYIAYRALTPTTPDL